MITIFRKEIKYVVNVFDFAFLREKISKVMNRDEHCSDFGYLVRSLYFDSIYDKDYYDTVFGLQSKAKVRLRIYGLNDTKVKLELKRKEGTVSKKYSLFLTKEEALQMQSGNYEFLKIRKEEVAQRIYIQLIKGGYLPKTLVEYNREAYTFPAGDVRVTFDTNLRATSSSCDLFSENPAWVPITSYGMGVLEVKYTSHLPEIIKKIIQTDRLQSSNSKYVQSREILKLGGSIK